MKIRKENIIEILDKYWIRRGWIESDESMVEARPLTAKEELADAILSLPLDVPSEEEIEEWVKLQKPIQATYYDAYRYAIQWVINEILKRNGKDK